MSLGKVCTESPGNVNRATLLLNDKNPRITPPFETDPTTAPTSLIAVTEKMGPTKEMLRNVHVPCATLSWPNPIALKMEIQRSKWIPVVLTNFVTMTSRSLSCIACKIDTDKTEPV
jgi:hypothetical protein